MRIITEYYEISLILRAESFILEEVARVGEALSALEIAYSAKPAPREGDRRVIIYTISDPREVDAFAEKLHINFQGFAKETDFVPAGKGMINYKCERVVGGGERRECLNLLADDDYAAFILCGMEAGKRLWLSAKDSRGFCSY